MIANVKSLEKYCQDYAKIENYEEALKSTLRYDLHHRLEIDEMQSRSDLIFLHLYFHRPPEELIFLEHGEHQRLHKANLSEDTRKKMSEAQKGKPKSAETRQRMSNAKKNLSAETRQKMSAAQKGNQNALGHHWNVSEETKQKISEALKGKRKMSEAKKGKRWHLENGHRIWTE